MNAARVLREARRAAGLTQRQLAERAGVPQPSIARIESKRVVPRVDTLDRLLRACGRSLEATRRLGEGVDRTHMRELLKLTASDRAAVAVASSNNVVRAVAVAKPVRR